MDPTWLTGLLGDIAYYEAGTGDPVVLVHAIDAAGSANEIEPLFEGLRADRRTIAFDLPGFGLSARPAVRYRPGHMRDALRRVIAHASTDSPVDVIALSLAGQYVASEAIATPERIRRLVLIGPTGVGRLGARRPGPWRLAVERWLQLPVIGDAVFGALRTRPSIDWYLDRTVVDPERIPEAVRAYAWQTSHQPGARFAPSSFIAGTLVVPGIEEAYARLPRPTLMLFGEEPRFSDPEAMRSAMAGVDAVTVDVIPGTRDLPHRERPDPTLARIRSFLEAPDLETHLRA
jgi:pimeloyl-ACP methyl ester carboxylesterase